MKCWFCHKETMEDAPDLGKGWFKCAHCGATHSPPLPEPGANSLGRTWTDKGGISHYHSGKSRKVKKVKK